MNRLINAKELRARLPEIVAAVRRGARYTILYRSRPACDLVPLNAGALSAAQDLEADSIYRAGPLGRSTDGRSAADHDSILYGR